MKNETMTNATTTAEQTVRPTTLCKILLTNAGYTNRYITKSNGETLFTKWSALSETVRTSAYTLYTALDNGETAENIQTAKNAYYSALSAVFAEIGDIPTADGKQGKRLVCTSQTVGTDGKQTAIDVALLGACMTIGKNEKAALQVARKGLSAIRSERAKDMNRETKRLFNSNGEQYNGISADAVKAYNEKEKAYADSIKTAETAVENLLKKSGNSVHAIVPQDSAKFRRTFEIFVKLAVAGQHAKTLEQLKAERAERNKKTAEQRKDSKKTDSAKKTDSKKTAGKSKTKTENK